MARSLGLGENVVRFHGFVEYGEALRVVAAQDAGLIPHHASKGWECTIPNKLFDYMSLGVPVISSDVTPVKRVLTETGAGVTFRDRDAHDLARVIRSLRADPGLEEMGRRGMEAVRERYNWERDARALGEVVDRVMAESAGSGR
jgi:glycosyltransferase involved in cell wall biosynthesis